MSAVTAVTNMNFLSPLNFSIKIQKCPNIDFFIQKVNIPGITLESSKYEQPFATIPEPGEKVTFEELEMTFKVQENLADWMEIYN